MRVTSSMYYENIYSSNNNKLSKELFDVNKQIASRLKIQYAHQDVGIFTDTMRLDNEVTVLGQVKKSTDSALKFSKQSDTTLNEFEDRLTKMKTLLNQAATATNSEASLDAISKELRGIEKYLKTLANTSINGEYIFSGSATNVKPISDDGVYKGNDVAMDAFLGSQSKQQYNVTGAELFLGEERNTKREITTNVVIRNLLADNIDLQTSPEDAEPLTSSSSIRQLMGDTDDVIDSEDKHFFYVRGTTSDGASFKDKFSMNDTQTVQNLLDKIGGAYGNTPDLKLVNVSMSNSGQIVIEDKQKGSSKLDFHMVGAVDFNESSLYNKADIGDSFYGVNANKIDNLDIGETDFKKIDSSTNTLFVKEFVKSGLTSATSSSSSIEGLVYDRTEFSKDGAKLSSNVSQIVKESNAFATNTTKLSEVFSGPLDGETLKFEGLDINGSAYNVNIRLSDLGSTFTVNAGTPIASTYDIYDVAGDPVSGNDLNYKQMMDIINMNITGQFPDASYGNDAAAFHEKAKNAASVGDTYLSYDGKIQFGEKNAVSTRATLALYDQNSSNFVANASIATFNTNNALTITDPKTDFFKSIDEIITAVEEYKMHPDTANGSPRSLGIQNAISRIDTLNEHVSRSHSTVGANSNALSRTLDRTTLLEISTMSLRSSVVDNDLAESTLRLKQIQLNYEAMLSTVGKVSKLSLINYL